MISSFQRLSRRIFNVFLNFLKSFQVDWRRIIILVALSGGKKLQQATPFASKRGNSTSIDSKFFAVIINVNPPAFRNGIDGFFDVIENLVVSVIIALGIEDDRLTAIRQQKGETLVIQLARKSTNRAKVNYVCTFLISKFYSTISTKPPQTCVSWYFRIV